MPPTFPTPRARASRAARGSGWRSTSESARRSLARSAIRLARILRGDVCQLELAIGSDGELEPDPVALLESRRNDSTRRAKRHGHRAHACTRNCAVFDQEPVRAHAQDLADSLVSLRSCRFRNLRAFHARPGRPQVRLRVDEELAGDDDLLADFESLADFRLAVCLGPRYDFDRLELAFADREHYDAARSRTDHGFRWDKERFLLRRRRKIDAHEHAGNEPPFGVRQLD